MKTLHLLAARLGRSRPAACAPRAKTTPDAPPLDMPAPPPRDVEPNEAEAPPPVPLISEPARSTPPRPRPRAARAGAARRAAEARSRRRPSRRRPSRRSRPRSRPAADDAADDAGDGGRRSRAGDSRDARARDRRSEPDRLPRAQRRREDAVRHGEAIHPAGGRGDARRRISCSRRTSPTRRPRWRLSWRRTVARYLRAGTSLSHRGRSSRLVRRSRENRSESARSAWHFACS